MTDPNWWNQATQRGTPSSTQPIPYHPTQPLQPVEPPRRRRGRGWTALLVVLACFALLTVAADRGAAILAERALGRGMQQQQGLAEPATASIAGFPFLTQAFAGHYRQIDLAAAVVPTGAGVPLDQVTVRLTDVTASAADLLAGRTDRLRAGRVAVRARVGYRSLDTLVAQRIDPDRLAVRFSDGGSNRLAVTGTVSTVLGELQVKGLVAAELTADGVRLGLVPGSVDGLPEVVGRLLADLLDVTVAAPAVSGIRPNGVEVGAAGVTLTGTGTDVPLSRLAG